MRFTGSLGSRGGPGHRCAARERGKLVGAASGSAAPPVGRGPALQPEGKARSRGAPGRSQPLEEDPRASREPPTLGSGVEAILRSAGAGLPAAVAIKSFGKSAPGTTSPGQ